jgi:hypothetical protein
MLLATSSTLEASLKRGENVAIDVKAHSPPTTVEIDLGLAKSCRRCLYQLSLVNWSCRLGEVLKEDHL